MCVSAAVWVRLWGHNFVYTFIVEGDNKSWERKSLNFIPKAWFQFSTRVMEMVRVGLQEINASLNVMSSPVKEAQQCAGVYAFLYKFSTPLFGLE